ncbi:hypothetical protein JCGZ_00590 [Jatropha curcas]|uniref:Uncharacterized protein n=1 Tax=Jatropha curcas TaxID=180498 RepID=A0A067JGA2_JATCU|nr:hypothetical protein JCGZ_00590 [Jatropha curcas]
MRPVTASLLQLQWSTCSYTQLLSSSKNLKNTNFTASFCSNFSTIVVRNNGGIGNQLHLRLPKSTLFLNCSLNQGATGENLPEDQQSHSQSEQSQGFWSKRKANSTEMSSKLAKLGLAAVLGYGLFDAITYTTFFVLAFLGYEKSTGKNPAANLQALLGIVILMWTGNNVTRPFRVAGAAALAPIIDRGLKKIQNYFKFPNLVYAFALIVSIVAALCLTIAGLLILSRWGR